MLDTSNCEDYLTEVLAFAKSRGLEDKLQEKLDYLDGYAGRENTVCKLFKDFAPHSFQFVIYRDREQMLHGGLIYQGPDQPADGSFPSLTVSLAKGTGWFVHT